MDILLYIVMWIVIAVSILLIPLGVPGTFMIAGISLLEGLLTDFVHLSPMLIVWLFVIAIALEGLEFLITGMSAKKYGASRAGIFGAITGAIFGAIIGSAILPVIGTLLGTLAGAYGGAVLVEFVRTNSTDVALRAGLGAFLGSAGGKLAKVVGGIFMVILIIRAFLQA